MAESQGGLKAAAKIFSFQGTSHRKFLFHRERPFTLLMAMFLFIFA
jgi:hypothetical protein